ncbi:MAG: LURP-one-related family protein [Clostridia bacterium]|nr:LURP-one-related family protein [Clostridia bacterium]
MKLLFKQRLFSWFDSYDIYDEGENVLFTVEGQLAWGHKLHIHDHRGEHIATIRQALFTFRPQFELYEGETLLGTIEKQWSLFTPAFELDFRGWDIEGSFMEWDYTITDRSGRTVAVITKELFNFTDTYVIDVDRESDALHALMVVLAIDAEKCSR